MRNKYQEYYNRIQNGERDIDIAIESGLTVSALYKRFTDYGIIKTKKRIDSNVWPEQYEAYKNGKSIQAIADDLDVQTTTVYNRFYALGLEMKPKAKLDKEALYQDYLDGIRYDELARKYNVTVTYVRFVIKSVKNKRRNICLPSKTDANI